jgi:hypothetical protein
MALATMLYFAATWGKGKSVIKWVCNVLIKLKGYERQRDYVTYIINEKTDRVASYPYRFAGEREGQREGTPRTRLLSDYTRCMHKEVSQLMQRTRSEVQARGGAGSLLVGGFSCFAHRLASQYR